MNIVMAMNMGGDDFIVKPFDQSMLMQKRIPDYAHAYGKPGKAVSREKLMEQLWESDSFIDENTLSVNVGRLRKKLGASAWAIYSHPPWRGVSDMKTWLRSRRQSRKMAPSPEIGEMILAGGKVTSRKSKNGCWQVVTIPPEN